VTGVYVPVVGTELGALMTIEGGAVTLFTGDMLLVDGA
jgi:hypothetical protein